MKRFSYVLVLLTALILVLSGCTELFDKVPTGTVPDQTVLEGNKLEVDLSQYVKDPEGGTITFTKKSGPGTISGTKYVLEPTWESPGAGEHTVQVEAKDRARKSIVVSFKVNVKKSALLELYVTEFNSGPAVKNADVIVKDGDKVVEQCKTDERGIARVYILHEDANPKYYNVFLSKENHGKTIINGLKFESHKKTELETTLRKAALGPASDNPIEVDIKFYEDSTKATEVTLPANISADTIYVTVTATPLDYPNTCNIIYAKAGGVPGAGTFANPRLYASDINSLSGTLSVKEFEGEIPIIVDVYDDNDTRVEYIFYVNVFRTPYYIVERNTTKYNTSYDLVAYTKRAPVEFYSNPIDKSKITALSKDGNVVPNAAPEGTNLWVTLYWLRQEMSTQSTTTTIPKAYRLYRSFDGENFEPFATVPATYYYFSDSSPKLEVGKRVWYAVSSVYDCLESTPTVIGSIELLPIPTIVYTGDALNGSKDVPRDPTFGWKFIVDKKYSDLVNADTKYTLKHRWDIWLYDEIVNDLVYYSLGVISSNGPAYYTFSNVATQTELEIKIKFSEQVFAGPTGWVDFAFGDYYANTYGYPFLQANKTYCWGNELLATQLEYNGLNSQDPNEKFKAISYAIHTDQNSRVTQYPVETDVYHTFTTGSN